MKSFEDCEFVYDDLVNGKEQGKREKTTRMSVVDAGKIE